MTRTRRAAATAALALAATTGAIAPAAAKPATTVYYDTKSCKATTALNPFVPDFTNLVQIQFTLPDRVGSGRGFYLKQVSILPGSNYAKARVDITSHEDPSFVQTWTYRGENHGTGWMRLRVPPETSRRNVTRIDVRTANLAANGAEHTACTIRFNQ